MQTPEIDVASGLAVEGDPNNSEPNPGAAGEHGRIALALAAGLALAAAFGSWIVNERTLDHFRPTEAAAKNIQDPGPLRRELAVIVPRNTAIAFGTFGALLGLSTGLAGGLSRRSSLASLRSAVVGGLVGCAAGAGLSFAIVPFFLAAYDPQQPSLMLTVLVRGGIGIGIGAAAGLAFGVGLGGRSRIARTIAGGLMGGFLGTVAFEILNALVNPLDRNDNPVPTNAVARLLCYLCIALFAATIASLSAPDPRPSSRSSAATS